MTSAFSLSNRWLWLSIATPALLLGLAGCGSSASAAAAAATPTCPATAAVTSETGKITAVSGTASVTITTTTGSTATVLLSTTTRITASTPVAASSLTTGTTVLVSVPANSSSGTAIPAQRVLVETATSTRGNGTPTAGNGTPGTGGGFGGGFPGRGSGTPGAGRGGSGSFNAACFRRTGTQGQNGVTGVQGTITTTNPGLGQITVTDSSGNSFVFALVSSTVIATQTRGTAANLTVGATITASGRQSTNGLQATTIQVTQ